jgi:L-rhamnose mutarotase
MRIKLVIDDITDSNKNEKFQKAIKKLSEELKIPATIEHKETHREQWPFKATERIYQQYIRDYGLVLDELCSRLFATLDLPIVSTFKKSIDEKAKSLFMGKVFYNPQNGKYLKEKDIQKLIDAVDRFLNRNTPKAKEIVLKQAAISRILAGLRIAGTSYEEIRQVEPEEMKWKGKKLDTVSSSYSALNDSFKNMDMQRVEFYRMNLANHIQNVNDNLKDQIRNTITHGMISGKSNHEISQELFDKFGDANKQWDRVIETESGNIQSAEYINGILADSEPGAKTYFIRREFIDDRTCSFCAQAVNKPVIALWVESPLSDDQIKDPVASIAIWAGKTNIGRQRDEWWWPEATAHARCRGTWDVYDEEFEALDFEIKKPPKEVKPESKEMLDAAARARAFLRQQRKAALNEV